MAAIGLLLAGIAGALFGIATVLMRKGIVGFAFSTNIIQLVQNLFAAKSVLASFLISGIAYILSITALRQAEAIPTTITITAVSYVALFISASLIIGEQITYGKIAGIVLILAGIIVAMAYG